MEKTVSAKQAEWFQRYQASTLSAKQADWTRRYDAKVR